MERGPAQGLGGARERDRVTAFLDTNVVVRHLTGEPAEQATNATALLASGRRLLLTDLVAGEIVYVLTSVCGVERPKVAMLLRSVIGFPSIAVVDELVLLRALEIYELDRLGFADAYLVASAERSGVGCVASFDRGIDRVGTVERVEPGVG